MTGRTSCWAPLMNAESRARVPPRRTNAYASDRPTAKRNTASARSARSFQLKAASDMRSAILGGGRGRDQARPDDDVVFVQNSSLPGRHGVGRLAEGEPKAAR